MKKYLLLILVCFFLISSIIQSQWKSIQLPNNSFNTAFAMDASDKNTCLITFNGTPKPGMLLTKDGGKTFVTFSNFLNTSEAIIDVSIIDSLNFWIVTNNRILYTSDCGKNWKTQFNDATQTDFFNYIKMFDLKNGIAMADSKSSSTKTLILRTSDGGNNWVNVNETLIGMSSGDIWRRIDFPTPQVGYFLESGIYPQETYKTLDGGKSWSLIDTPTGIMVLKFYNENIGAIIYNNYSPSVLNLSVTSDGGKTWPSKIAISNSWGSAIEFIPKNPGRILAANMNNVYFSIDTGKTWKQVNLPATNNIRAIKFTDEKAGWILCDNGFLFKTENADYLTTDARKENELPTQLLLHQNYPNPFNPETNISYQILKAGNVSLKVYDILGREVAILVNEFKQPGTYNSTFSIMNYTLPSGVYFYRLQAGNNVANKKMVLMK